VTAPGSWIDSHAHLAMEEFAPDLPEVVERARQAGVGGILVVGTCPEDWEPSTRTAARFGFRTTAGLHPHEARRWGESGALLRRALGDPLVAAVGEVGLDYHYDLSPREDQRRAFEAQVALALEAGLPVVVHSREAFEDTLAILRSAGPSLRGVLHCFTYGPAEAEAFLALGLHLSFSGIAVFPKAPEVRQAARATPLERLLVETDAPYLAPPPFRGKRCEPAYVVRVGECLAEDRGLAPHEVARATAENARRLFGLGDGAVLPVEKEGP